MLPRARFVLFIATIMNFLIHITWFTTYTYVIYRKLLAKMYIKQRAGV